MQLPMLLKNEKPKVMSKEEAEDLVGGGGSVNV
jgi:hypothetical protein